MCFPENFSILQEMIEDTKMKTTFDEEKSLDLILKIGESCVIKDKHYDYIGSHSKPFKLMYTRLNYTDYLWLSSDGKTGRDTDLLFDTEFWEKL